MHLSSEKKTLIVAMGSDILSDDGLPSMILRDLHNELNLENLTFLRFETGGLDILGHLRAYNEVLFMDTVKTKNGKPGDVYSFSLDNFSETHHLSSQHDGSFLDTIKLGHLLYDDMPKKINIIAVEISEDKVFSDSLSPELERIYFQIFTLVSTITKNILNIAGK